MELSSLFNKKGQAIVFSEKIGFTSKFLLSEDDYVPGLRNCFVHYFELILFHLGLCPYSCYYLFTFCLLFYSMYRIVSLLLSSLLEPLMEMSFLSKVLARRVFSRPMDAHFWKKHKENSPLIRLRENVNSGRPVFNVWLKACSYPLPCYNPGANVII